MRKPQNLDTLPTREKMNTHKCRKMKREDVMKHKRKK